MSRSRSSSHPRSPSFGEPARVRPEIREALPADDAGIRALLRQEAMPGRIRLTYQREPGFFAGCALMGEGCRTLVASLPGPAQQDQILGLACRATRLVYCNGEPCRIGYLGQLRVASGARGRWLVSRGFAALRRMHEQDPVPAYLLSIVDGNREAAGILLHKPRPGFPLLQEIAHYRTLALTIRRPRPKPASRWTLSPPAPAQLDELTAFLNQQGSRRQLATVWTPERLRSLAPYGLTLNDIRLARNPHGEITAVAALWDQRRFKQAVVERYTGWLAHARPAYNLAARLLARPPLPGPGEPIRSAYVALFHVADDDPTLAAAMLRELQAMAHARNLDYLIAGFDTRDPLLAVAARSPHVPYSSRLYLARWPDAHGHKGGLLDQQDGQLGSPDGRPVHVEAASL